MKSDARRIEYNLVFDLPISNNGKELYNESDFERLLFDTLDMLGNEGIFFACIKHDKDIKEDGTLKRVHWHCYIKLPKIKRVSTMLYCFSRAFDIESTTFIQIREVYSREGSIQYLIHKNDITKYQYATSSIYTNFSEDYLLDCMAKDTTEPVTTALLFHLVDMGLSNTEIMFIIGAGQFALHSKCISLLKRDIHNQASWDRLRAKYLKNANFQDYGINIDTNSNI